MIRNAYPTGLARCLHIPAPVLYCHMCRRNAAVSKSAGDPIVSPGFRVLRSHDCLTDCVRVGDNQILRRIPHWLVAHGFLWHLAKLIAGPAGVT
ncbi:MAG: hypothetical protein BWZ07_02217 [Alphaproteobacteria bacterium ADurb.BinA280]|jgi:hypothetical protein|nr:hypothetical protein [Aquimonas sp.]OPZ11133.1 MAG: hypothetical protein BWZ07_02217 [Alphaproteobacteria bacterium ADurb.BinA280]